MAFIDEIGKKVSGFGGDLLGKGKAFTDVARLNSEISEEERTINNAYYQIGKLYVALHPQDYEADFGSNIDLINAAQERINFKRQQIQEIKGVTVCPSCGAEVQNTSAFCPVCGKPMPKRESIIDENHVKCSCGAVNDKNMRFCTSCGRALAKPAQTSAPAEQPPVAVPVDMPVTNDIPVAPVTEPEPALQVGVICPSCGAEIRDGSRFCTMCGFDLEGPPASDDAVPTTSDSAKKVCPTCGTPIDDDMAFCVECGTPLN